MSDWHDSNCSKWEGHDMVGEPMTIPCDCGFPELVKGAVVSERERIRRAIEAMPADEQCYCDADRRPESDQLYAHLEVVLAIVDGSAGKAE